MTIEREYKLPNCTLILKGTNGTSSSEGEPSISNLVSAGCQFLNSERSLSGGQDFFESLVKAVNACAQEFLSGIHHPNPSKESDSKVELEKVDNKNSYRLTWQPAGGNREKVEIELTTLQLFDLVEAVDQFFADNATLPDMSLELQPVSRRYRKPDEPLAKRTAPAGLGMGSLALVATMLFFTPVPEIERPKEEQPTANPTEIIPSDSEDSRDPKNNNPESTE